MSDDGAAPRRRTYRQRDEYEAYEDEVYAAGFQVRRSDPYTRMSGTTWDPRDKARLDGTELPSGRQADIGADLAGPVTISYLPGFEPKTKEQRIEAARELPVAADWATKYGRVEVRGEMKIWNGPCAECSETFEQARQKTTKRPWDTVCSGCKPARKRRLAAERQRAKRARDRHASQYGL
ncbi:hypothetical protein ACFPA8_12340 [Streptomyces ovatisporus]|uniref:Uncharacterized protein n=1 Tax=Streptomyces ovatisporus TaxID=1128682 RepID=A0ABV9A4V2_9ACTN